MSDSILTPMLALILWTFVMWGWMYATRIPAMHRAGIDPGQAREKADLAALPSEVRRVADNYNHLHEQPTVFFALVVYCHLAGTADGINIALAWIYVALRVAHSAVQALWNFPPVRFALFASSSLTLMAIALRCLI